MTLGSNIVRVAVGLEVRDNRVLLVQRHSTDIPAWSLAWCAPGGKIEPGETPEVALSREWQEELGCTCAVGPLLCAMTYRTPGYAQPYTVSTYLVRSDGEPVLTPAGGCDLQWLALTHLQYYRCLPSTHMALEAFNALSFFNVLGGK